MVAVVIVTVVVVANSNSGSSNDRGPHGSSSSRDRFHEIYVVKSKV